MTKQEQLHSLCMDMIAYDGGDPARIQHFLKVHAFGVLIAEAEGVDEHTKYIIEAVTYVHDVGIRAAMQKYGHQTWKLQEELGPEPARRLLEKNGFEEKDIGRICWLVGHHHTFDNIEGDDYQILVEADFLVNLFERNTSKEAKESAFEKYFRTDTGRKIFRTMFETC